MKLGCFGYESQISLIKNAGYESAELDISEIINMCEESYKEFKSKTLDSGLGFEVFSGLIPLSERIYSDTFDMQYWLDHIKRVSERIKPLGALMVPFGAGKCRSIPDNCKDVNLVKDKIIYFVRNISEIFEEYNIKLVIEPLGRAYSNYVNTLSDAVEFIKLVNHNKTIVKSCVT